VGCAYDICYRLCLPSLWLGSHGDYFPAAPSLSPLALSSSLIRCELVQVYHHYLLSRVPLDPLYHIIYPRYYLVQALPWGVKLGVTFFHVVEPIEPQVVTLMVV
jgi:hypothetical protein